MALLNWNVVKSEYFFEEDTSNKNDGYLFKNQLEQIKEGVKNFEESKGKNVSKILGVVGERGSGKSSFLGTTANALKKDYFVFDVIDPSTLNANFSILELFLIEIYKEVSSFPVDKESSFYYNAFENNLKERRRIILTKLKDITKMFSNLERKDDFRKDSPSVDILENILETTSFDRKLKELVVDFLLYTNEKNKSTKKDIIICIDDLDLVSNENIYFILEGIRKYLSKNITVIIAYREQQLYNSVVHEKVKENSHLLDYGRTYIEHEEIKNQASKYIEKFIPTSQRVYLPGNNEILGKPLVDFLVPLIDPKIDDRKKKEKIKEIFIDDYQVSTNENIHYLMTVSDWFYSAIKFKTKINLKPIDKKEESKYILPNNIRGIFQLIEIIHEKMKLSVDIDNNTDKEKIINEKINNLIENIAILKNNIISSAMEHFSEEDRKLYEQWELANYSSKNYVIYENLFWRIMDSSSTLNNVYPKENVDSLLRITEVQPYNISIGDIFFILEEYKKVSGNTVEKIYYIYCIKILYSMLLLELYLKAALEQNETDINKAHLEQYLSIINVKMMPDSFVYFETSNNIKKQYTKNLEAPYEAYYRYLKNNKVNEVFIEKVTYSTVSVGSEVRALNRATLGSEYKKDKYDIFKYRYFFSYDELKLTDKYQYLYDPFVFMAKKEYVKKTITQLGKTNDYVFYSLFDIDIFTRINYTRQTQQRENDLTYMLRKINRIFNEEADFRLSQPSEIGFLKRLTGPLFEINNVQKENIYSDDEVEFSDYFFENMVLNKKLPNSLNKRMKKEDYLVRAKTVLNNKDLTSDDYKKLSESVGRFNNSPTAQLKNDEKDLLLNLENKYNINVEL